MLPGISTGGGGFSGSSGASGDAKSSSTTTQKVGNITFGKSAKVDKDTTMIIAGAAVLLALIFKRG